MPVLRNDQIASELLVDLHSLAGQAARILQYLSQTPTSVSGSDAELAGRVGGVSAQQVALVKRSLLRTGVAVENGFALRIVAHPGQLARFAANLDGVSIYLRSHKDADAVRVVITEPGNNSALRREINRRGLPPRLFQTRDAFLNLAHGTERVLTVLAPFLDDSGCEFLIDLYSVCRPGAAKELICRPLNEPHCGDAFRRREKEFKRLAVAVYEYALPSALPSGRETFHAKVVLVDQAAYYVGSSNFMASALDRSLECGVIVHGASARELRSVIEALKTVAVRALW
jgi:phosphatidylserine/phosphatidylglycerophosphate/cardiolipin synthase-like enzyme